MSASAGLEALTPWLFSRTAGGVRWGLDRTRELLAGVGDPHRHFRSLHVAGTNGKGSVAALSATALREARAGAAGPPIGLYSSPHLVSFSERIRLDGVPAPDGLVLSAAERLRPAIERTGATFFEATTAIAFLCFAEAGVDLAVVEVGLGGRLDATNVIDPLACAITNVSLEHTEYLGSEIGGIAREKAGILKPGTPAITGETGAEALSVIRAVARTVGAPLMELDTVSAVSDVRVGPGGTSFRMDSRAWGERRVEVPLAGEHQARNAAVAAELLALLPSDLKPDWTAVSRGFRSTGWPGRLQVERIRGTTWVLDVAHNAAGARVLVEALGSLDLPRPWVLVFAALRDKEWREMLDPLLGRTDAEILTIPSSAPPDRRWDPMPAVEWAHAQGRGQPRLIPDLADAIRRASTLAPHGTVIVTGSFHTVGEAMSELGVPAT